MVNVGEISSWWFTRIRSGNNDPAVGSNFLASFPPTVQALDTWNVYDLPAPVALNGPGDVIIGVVGLEIPGTSYWPASMDQTTTQQRSWAGWYLSSPPPDPPLLPPDDTWILIDTYFPGNWMVRGYGETVVLPSQVNISFDVVITSQGDPVVNTADLLWEGLTGTATATTEVLFPEIGLAKTVGTEAGVCATTDQILVLQGTTVYYCYTVTNTGTATFSTHDLFDDQLGPLFAGMDYLLVPEASTQYITSTVITTDTENAALWKAWADEIHFAEATDSATVKIARADLSVTKTGPAVALIGDLITYTVNVENLGLDDATNVAAVDTLPVGAAFVSAAGCSFDTGVVTCEVAALPVGEDASFEIVITMDVPGDILNTVTATADQLDEDLTNNTATFATTVVAPDIEVAPLLLEKTLMVGETGTLPFTISNVGDADLAWNLAEDPVVSWLSELPVSGTIAPAGSTEVVVTFDAAGLTPGVYPTSILVSSDDPDEAVVTVEVVLTVTAIPVPDIEVTADPLEMVLDPDTTGTLAFTIGNVGGADLVWSLADDAGWLSVLPASGTIAPAGSTEVTVTFDATGLAAGTYHATITITSNDPDEASITLDVTLTVNEIVPSGYQFYLPIIFK